VNGPRVWPVFAAYFLAVLGILSFSFVAAVALREIYPDLGGRDLFTTLPGLLAGALASSTALVVTVMVAARPTDATQLRLRPGRETGGQLVAMIVGTLALGQALDSVTTLAGLGDYGSMAVIRHALERARGPELFAAVVIIGVGAGAAEEVFFRGYMLPRLAERWPPAAAIGVSSLGFAVLHVEWLHALLAFVLGLYFGFITLKAGSALPAVACHVINNSLFTVLTAVVGDVRDPEVNAALGAAAVVVFAASALWLHRVLR
jgi:membrane protease YdiL (CAAX protease family)